jgi:NTE family protein
LAENLPVKTARMLGAERVIGIDVSPKTDLTAPPTNLVEVLMQSFLIIGRHSAVQQAATADLLVEPQASHIRLDELERVSELIALGELAMREAMPQALALLNPVNQPSSIIKNWFSWRSAPDELA